MSCKHRTVYLAGGIAGLAPSEVLDRFSVAECALSAAGFFVLSPIRGKKLDLEVGQRYEPNEIVTRDLDDIRRSDFLIVEPSEISIGSYMEIIYAREVCKIPVVVVTTNQHISNHYWIRVYASKVVESIDAAVAYLNQWYL